MANIEKTLDYDFSLFSKNLKALLDSRGMTLSSLSDNVNITNATLSRYLLGLRRPSVEYVVALAKYFNVSVDWILGIQDDRYADVIDKSTAKMINLYTKSSPEDKRIVDMILSKYDD